MRGVCYNLIMSGKTTIFGNFGLKLCMLLCMSGLVLMPALPGLCAPSGCGSNPAACAECPNCSDVNESREASCCTLSEPDNAQAVGSACCSTEHTGGGWLAAHSCPCSMSAPTQPAQSARVAVEVQVKRAHDFSAALYLLLPAEPISAVNDVKFQGAMSHAAPPKLAQLCRYRC